jgi:ketosteroid isomerase-like protein
MDTRPRAEIQDEREAMFLRNMDAFMRHDFATIEGSMRSDVVLELSGTSWLAGSYHGYEDVSRSIVSLRRVFDSEKEQLSFLHEGDQMIVRHDIVVHGPCTRSRWPCV